MFTIEEKIKYIKDNIDSKSRKEIMEYLSMKSQTLSKITRDNNILNNRTYRYCPACDSIIHHKDSSIRIRQENEKRNCLKCSNSGENNAFYNKQHTENTKIFLSNIHKGKRYSPNTEFKLGSKGNSTSIYDCWIKRHGKEIADEKLLSFKRKQSENNKGENNPMYGKPSPVGSGNGWSGWYKGWYFRSLLELSYMIFVIERFNLNWECGEKKKNKIEYYIDGGKRNYFPDFIINNKYVVECKPRSLWASEINKSKFYYAKRYCSENNKIFKVVDCVKIKPTELIVVYNKGELRFTDLYEEKINMMIRKLA